MPVADIETGIQTARRAVSAGRSRSSIQGPRSIIRSRSPAHPSAVQRCPSQANSSACGRALRQASSATRSAITVTTSHARPLGNRRWAAPQANSAAVATAGSRVTTQRQAQPGLHATLTAGAERTVDQTRRKTSVPLVPPKPKLFFTATSIFICRASLAQ